MYIFTDSGLNQSERKLVSLRSIYTQCVYVKNQYEELWNGKIYIRSTYILNSSVSTKKSDKT